VSAALVIQRENRMGFIILLFMACPTLPHFATLPHNEKILVKEITEHKILFLFHLKYFSEKFLTLS